MPLNNFGIVRAFSPTALPIYRSAQPDAVAWETLRALGVGAAIKVDTPSDYPAGRESAEAGPNIQIAEFPVNQWRPDIPSIRGVVQQIISLSSTTGVLIHCLHGRDRTGLVVGAYRLIVQGWSLDRVLTERGLYGVVGLIALADREITEALEQIVGSL